MIMQIYDHVTEDRMEKMIAMVNNHNNNDKTI